MAVLFSGDNFRTFLDLKTTFWLSFYYFLHCTPYLNKNSAKSFCVFLCFFFFFVCVCFFFVCFFFYRTSKDRKKEREVPDIRILGSFYDKVT